MSNAGNNLGVGAGTNRPLLGALLVAVAASLWATDALFRFPMLQKLSPITLVTIEHFIALLVLTPVVIFGAKQVFNLSLKEWCAAWLIGAGGSAFATVLFTSSFQLINPSVTILLQKLQPVLTSLLAFVFLKDRPKKAFFLFAPISLIAAIVVSFPDFDFSFLRSGMDLQAQGVIFALLAALIWSISTIAGKILLNRTSPLVSTFWRFWFGFITLLAIQLTLATSLIAPAEMTIPWEVFEDAESLKKLFYMSLIPGLVAVFIYYEGLKRTHATTATFVELLFPVAAVVLNTIFLDMPLNEVQIGAAVVLLISVTAISVKGQSHRR